MLLKSFAALAAWIPATVACAHHENFATAGDLAKRQTQAEERDWSYEASYNWGMINENYSLCQTGTQQSPIALQLNQGLSLNHVPTFEYPSNVTGNFYNWGYGPAFTLDAPEANYSGNPRLHFDNETVYLKGWHVHSPADHTVANDRSKGELHLVHCDESGHERAVLALRLDPGAANSSFFAQLPKLIPFNDTETQEELSLNMELALDDVHMFDEFWTYQGSLTSPPCREGIRWFVARQILFTSVAQMRAILAASTYSSRTEQEVWLHQINV